MSSSSLSGLGFGLGVGIRPGFGAVGRGSGCGTGRVGTGCGCGTAIDGMGGGGVTWGAARMVRPEVRKVRREDCLSEYIVTSCYDGSVVESV